MRGTLDRRDEIDGMLTTHAQNWRVERMNVIDRLVLRLAVFEMLAESETPSKVIINEAIELARSFSGDAAVGFVNGVLDAVRKELRSELECSHVRCGPSERADVRRGSALAERCGATWVPRCDERWRSGSD